MRQQIIIAEGEHGIDSGNEFRVIDQRGAEVLIEYVEDGRQAWFARNRFGRTSNNSLKLN